MVNICAHRGLWNTPAEQNSIKAIKHALQQGFSLEIDLWSKEKDFVVCHDDPSTHGQYYPFNQLESILSTNTPFFLDFKGEHYPQLISEKIEKNSNIFFNNLSPLLKAKLEEENFQCLKSINRLEDLSMIGTEKYLLIDIEEENTLDRFLDLEIAENRKLEFYISSEILGREPYPLWRKILSRRFNNIVICTDLFQEAKDYFK